MKQIYLFLTSVFMITLFTPAVLKAQNAEDPYVILTEYEFKEANSDDAIDLLSDLQQKTLESEEGCMVFDVLLSDENPAKVFVYESYESNKAYNAHIKRAYYNELYTKKLKPFIKQEKVNKVYPLNFENESPNSEF